jgi:hypothetical protein
MSYSVLYNYASAAFALVELKLANSSLPRNKRYYWLLLDLKQQSIQRLTFKSMKDNQREFGEGSSVVLHSDRAEYTTDKGELIQLPVCETTPQLVDDYVTSL